MAKANLDMYRRVFGQGEGEVILEDLVTRFAVRADTSGIEGILKTYYNAGARDVLEHIISKVDQARQEIMPRADTDDEHE
jgi:hypothetical protein